MIYYIIYETTNLVNGKKYRGIHKTKKLEDGYFGSGFAIEEAIEKYGKKNFEREILEFCSSYDELLEKEKIYVDEDWVRDHSNYNLKTGGQSAGVMSDESKRKLSETLKKRYIETGILPISAWKIGNEPWNKNREGIYSEEHIKKISTELKRRYENGEIKPWNKNTIGMQEAWNKGLNTGPQSEEEKKKKSETLKKRYETEEHHLKGVEPWNKGKKGIQIAWNKGKEMEKIECPYCRKMVDIGNGKRWHFDNCKLKNYDE